MNQVVYLNEARIHTFTGSYGGQKDNLVAPQVVLKPGRNTVPEDIFENVRKSSDSLQHLIETAVVVVQGEGVDIAKMPVPKALQTIDLETTVTGVRDLLDQEIASKKPRKTVTDAAEAKITAIEAADKEASAKASMKAKGDQKADGSPN